jgi:hypothetical protein
MIENKIKNSEIKLDKTVNILFNPKFYPKILKIENSIK